MLFMTGGNCSVIYKLITNLFEGKTLLEQHQMVYSPLRETLKEQLHALALKTYTPEQWKKK